MSQALATTLLVTLLGQTTSKKLLTSQPDSCTASDALVDGAVITITAECDDEYIGTATIDSCSTDGDGSNPPFTLSGCVAEQCVTPTTPGYAVTQTQATRPGFNVTAVCAEKYKGTAIVTKCPRHGDPYQLDGCQPKKCERPESLRGYSVTELSMEMPDFFVQAACEPDFYAPGGTPGTTSCSDDGGEYQLYGCHAETCRTPHGALEYNLTEVSRDRDDFEVTVSCADGYEGSARAFVCPGHNQPYDVRGCSAKTCKKPSTPGYLFVEGSVAIPTFDVNVSCAAGYHLCNASEQPHATACEISRHSYTVTGCCSSICESPPNDGYAVTENSLTFEGFEVLVACGDGYDGTPVVQVCSSNGTNYSLAGCSPVSCTTPTLTGYIVNLTHLTKGDFDVKVSCDTASGFQQGLQAPVATECDSHGGPYKVEGCIEKKCAPPLSSVGYNYTEFSRDIPNFHVDVTCDTGYTGLPHVIPCRDEDEPYNFSGCQEVYYVQDAPCPPQHTISLPQECYIASLRLDSQMSKSVTESMSVDGLEATEDYYPGCFIKREAMTADAMSLSFNTNQHVASVTQNASYVCSRRTTPIEMNFSLQVPSARSYDYDNGGVDHCKSQPSDPKCCQVWERIRTKEQCKTAGLSLQLNTANVIDECNPGIVAGCFYVRSMGEVRFEVDRPQDGCGSTTGTESYVVEHICEKIRV